MVAVPAAEFDATIRAPTGAIHSVHVHRGSTHHHPRPSQLLSTPTQRQPCSRLFRRGRRSRWRRRSELDHGYAPPTLSTSRHRCGAPMPLARDAGISCTTGPGRPADVTRREGSIPPMDRGGSGGPLAVDGSETRAACRRDDGWDYIRRPGPFPTRRIQNFLAAHRRRRR